MARADIPGSADETQKIEHPRAGVVPVKLFGLAGDQ
jgi:hypothetical protein